MVQILVVEDDPDVGNFLVRGLGEAGYNVTWANNGHDGMTHALSGKHDLIILDRQLGDGIDGIDVLKAMRANQIHIPALFLSGLGEISDWVQGLQAGGDDYLVKPVALNDLLTRVATATRREQATVDVTPG